MGNPGSPKQHYRFFFLYALFSLQTSVLAKIQYKVGDLDSWGLPAISKPVVYADWAKNHIFQIGDSLLFLYPPSQDSMTQLTKQAYDACNITDPILYMDDGNSLFNITAPGRFYFTSGVPGRCEKSQKLEISVGFANGSALPPDTSMPEIAPAYPTVFGNIPRSPSPSPSASLSASSPTSLRVRGVLHLLVASAIGFCLGWQLI